VGTLWARNLEQETDGRDLYHLTWFFPVVGTGVDPVASRFSGRFG
jgi:hypothetical protein